MKKKLLFIFALIYSMNLYADNTDNTPDCLKEYAECLKNLHIDPKNPYTMDVKCVNKCINKIGTLQGEGNKNDHGNNQGSKPKKENNPEKKQEKPNNENTCPSSCAKVEKVNENEKNIKKNTDKLDEHDKKIKDNTNKLEEHDKKINDNSSKLDEHDKKIKDNTDKLNGLDLEYLRLDGSNLKGDLVEKMFTISKDEEISKKIIEEIEKKKEQEHSGGKKWWDNVSNFFKKKISDVQSYYGKTNRLIMTNLNDLTDIVNTKARSDGANLTALEKIKFRKSINAIENVDNVIKTNHIENKNITEEKLADNSVSTRTIQNNAITEEKLADNSVSTRTIQNNAITEEKLANNSISTRTIQDKAITFDKLSKDIQTRFNGAEDKINIIQKDLSNTNSGIAAVAAIANIPAQYKNGLVTLGFGSGYFNKVGAFAIGVQGKIKESPFAYKLSGAVSTKGTVALGGGFSYTFKTVEEERKIDNKIEKKFDKESIRLQKRMRMLEEELNALKEFIIENNIERTK
ncbi:YadA C-terminal domain-containing protein [uncultured Sneathia sp.]|jgi:hypothetical protein|uniref:YadA C-terminal domain-containing protein n=1 Tax=uncultured Sneathia sp. TaxID=278067 RepID=UPI00258AE91F|nr:YadA C-terminal domain-containing protein [uncultured Sneathia sp.]